MITGYCKKPTTFNKDDGELWKKINMFCCFPRSTMIRVRLMPFKTMSATLTVAFLCFEMSKNCFPTTELFPKRQPIHQLI